MKLNEQKLQQLAKYPYPTFSKPVVWTIRAVMLILLGLWIAGGLYLNNQVKQDEERIEKSRIEAQQREDRLRRSAQYQQSLQERSRKPQTRNAIDSL